MSCLEEKNELERQKKLFEIELIKAIEFLNLEHHIRLTDITCGRLHNDTFYSFDVLIVYYIPDKSQCAIYELDGVYFKENTVLMRVWITKYLTQFYTDCLL